MSEIRMSARVDPLGFIKFCCVYGMFDATGVWEQVKVSTSTVTVRMWVWSVSIYSPVTGLNPAEKLLSNLPRKQAVPVPPAGQSMRTS